MAAGKVGDVNEVPHGSSVNRVPVRPEDLQRGRHPSQHPSDDREQVRGLLARIFTKKTRLVAADWVEVAQCSDLPRGISVRNVCKDGLAKVLRAAV